MRKIKFFIFSILSWLASLVAFFYWMLVHMYKSDFRNHIKKNHTEKEIDIIVNGPSFTDQADKIKNNGHDKCMVNFAANTSVFWDIKPSYYCVTDPAFFRNNMEKDVTLLIENLKKVDWALTFYVTYYDYKHHIENTELDRFKHVSFVPFHSTAFPFSFRFRKLAYWLFSRGQAMPHTTSVSVPVIMNAINTGYTRINLYGYDQDWIHNVVVDDSNRVCLFDTHYYNEAGEYRPWLKNPKETFTMYEIMHSQAELFETYWFIRQYIDYLGNVRIINHSPNSLIDAFERSNK